MLKIAAVVVLCLAAGATQAQLTQRCNWGVGPLAPVVHAASIQVMSLPVVMDLGHPGAGFSHVAFVSFEGNTNLTQSGGGVLRVIDPKCKEIAQFPPPAPTGPVPAGCPANLYSSFFSPTAGLAAGDIDGVPGAEIIAVLDDPSAASHQ